MASQKGRDLVLKIGDGAGAEVFTDLGSARMIAMSLSNRPLDATSMDGGGVQALRAGGGVQALQVRLEGLFRDSAAEELLRAAALGRLVRNYKIAFPNGDVYAAAFVVQDYGRAATHDGFETFTVTLLRSGSGTYTAA